MNEFNNHLINHSNIRTYSSIHFQCVESLDKFSG